MEYYKLLKEMPAVRLKEGTLFKYNPETNTALIVDREYAGEFSFLNFHNNNYFTRVNINEAKFNEGDVVIVKGDDGYGHGIYQIYKKIQVSDYSNTISYKYQLNEIRKSRYSGLYSGANHPVKEEDLTIAPIYWFINSSGHVSPEYHYEWTQVTEFRKKMNNYFSSKDSAVAFLKKIKSAKEININFKFDE